MEITLQDNFLTLRRLSVCNLLNFDDFVIKAGFHRLWLIYIFFIKCTTFLSSVTCLGPPLSKTVRR